jgi:lactate permease
MPVGQALLAAPRARRSVLPDPLDRHQRDLGLQPHRRSGHFDVLRRSFEKVSSDQRVQAIIIAFCFGALLEALAGLRHAGGDHRRHADGPGLPADEGRRRRLVANTARSRSARWPRRSSRWATGDLGRQQTTPADHRHARRHGRPADPLLAVVVPLILVSSSTAARRGQTWLPAIVCGVAFAVAQFVASNYISVPLTDIIASLVAAGSVVLLVRVWQPAEVLTAEPVEAASRVRRRRRGRRRRSAPRTATSRPPTTATPRDVRARATRRTS